MTRAKKEKPRIIMKKRFVIAKIVLLLYLIRFIVPFVELFYLRFIGNLIASFAINGTESKSTDVTIGFSDGRY